MRPTHLRQWAQLIEKVELHELDKEKYDRRGPIATFTFKQVPNHELAVMGTVRLIQTIQTLLSDHYVMLFGDEGEGAEFGEQNESWINDLVSEPHKIVLRHKYWSDEKVTAFREIILVVARLHDWVVVINSEDTHVRG